ncbi:metallophosphoesterase [Planctobacterium marinum]|uniref:Serine/threonine protein phosphatase n=1 Tax=Planctobacterium marinum TaxID=1631968 RepID=A0AA48HTW6_9ALTE|nr:serine/threonine protein phosphatase [Planctobacterium marinum]
MTSPLFQKYAVASKHAWIVGDIHGQYELLLQVLKQKGFDPGSGDRLFSVGDLIDRGPDSLKTLQLLNEPWFYAVMGNHEQLLLKGLAAMQGEGSVADILNWQSFNGGDWYQPKSDTALQVAALLEKVRTLPIAIELETESGRVGIVHAAVPDNIWLDINLLSHADSQKYILWNRDNGLKARSFEQGELPSNDGNLHRVEGIDKLVVGHTIMNCGHPVLLGNTLYLDVGAANGVAPAVISASDLLALNRQGRQVS